MEMVSILDKKQIRPNPTLVSTLARIGELRNCLSTLEQNASKALGLDVEIISFDTQTYQATGSKFFRDSIKKLERLRVTAGPNVCVEAWKELEKHADWTFSCYESGDWENRCQPTLRLVQWIYEWGGLHADKQPTLQIAVDGFKRRGELLLPLRNETSGRLCGKCGEEVKDLEEHISALHLGPDSALTLYLYMEEKDGKKSMKIGRGRDQHRQWWSIPEELYIADRHDHEYRLGLSNDINNLVMKSGKSRLLKRDQKLALPYNITLFPFLAHVVRALTR